jgi:cobalt-zinc-cadmium efflux system membrane fusion protein
MNFPASRTATWVVAIVAGVLVVAAVGFVVVLPQLRRDAASGSAPKETEAPAELVLDARNEPLQPPTVRLLPRTAKSLGIVPGGVFTVKIPKHQRALPPQMGTLAYDNDRLYAVRSRFAGEVSEILDCPPDQRGSIPLPPANPLAKSSSLFPGPKENGRPFTVGDRVKANEILAVVWSKDLADKKAALIDAIIDLRRDSARFKDLEKLYYEGSVPANTYYEADRTVQKGLSARNAAERILRVWKLTDAEIDELKREAEIIREDKRDPKREKDWARVEVRAPHDGVIVEKNTHLGDWTDPSNYATPMFRVADLTRLQVWLSPAEELLPALQAFLKKPTAEPLSWDIYLQAEPRAPALGGALLRLAPSLDYNQHTPLLVGVIDNPQGRLLVGQFVTATIYVPLEDDLVEIPTSALNEEKGQGVVFVQRDPQQPGQLEFTLKAVAVVYRFKDVVYVRSRITKEQQENLPGPLPVEALHPGERVVTESVVELTKALRDLLAKADLTGRHGSK